MSKFSFRLRKKFLTTLLVVTGVVFIWRGLWNLMDFYIFPDRPLVSNVLGILIGILMLYLPDEDIKELV